MNDKDTQSCGSRKDCLSFSKENVVLQWPLHTHVESPGKKTPLSRNLSHPEVLKFVGKWVIYTSLTDDTRSEVSKSPPVLSVLGTKVILNFISPPSFYFGSSLFNHSFIVDQMWFLFCLPTRLPFIESQYPNSGLLFFMSTFLVLIIVSTISLSGIYCP